MTYRAQDQGAASAERRRRQIFVAFWTAVVLGVLVAFRGVLVPFLLATVIAYILSPVVRRLTGVRIGGRNVPRWVAVLAIYIVLLSTLAVSVRSVAPILGGEIHDFVRNELPRLADDARDRWLPAIRSMNDRFVTPIARHTGQAPETHPDWAATDHTVHIEPLEGGGYRVLLPLDGITVQRDGNDRMRVLPTRIADDERRGELGAVIERVRALGAGHTDDLVRLGRGIIGSVVGGVFVFFMTMMLSAYMLVTQDRIFGFFESLVPPARRPAYEELLERMDRGLSGVVRGQVIICGINGVLSAVGFAIAGIEYWPLFALLAAIFSLIPIFGSILSAVPAVAVGLTHGLGTGLFVLAWILGIHQLEANLLNPKIMGDAARINPVLVFFSLLAGEHFFGILGALLAVPAMSMTQSVFLHWRKYALSYGDPAIVRDSLTPARDAAPEAIAPTPGASTPPG